MELWSYQDLLFTNEFEAQCWVAENEVYVGEEGLLLLFNEEIHAIYDFEDLLWFAKKNDMTINYIIENYNIDFRNFIMQD